MTRIPAILLLSSVAARADARPRPGRVAEARQRHYVQRRRWRALGNQPSVGVTTRVGPR